MITAVIGSDDRNLLVIGLERENVSRMLAGEPVFMELEGNPAWAGTQAILSQSGKPFEVLVVYGDSPQDVLATLRKLGLEMPDVTDEEIAAAEASGVVKLTGDFEL